MIIQDNAGSYYKVRDLADPDLSHVWVGVRVTLRTDKVEDVYARGGFRKERYFAPTKGGREMLVRKFGCKVVQE